MPDKKPKIPLIKNLWQRRVPQILGIYLGSGWAIVEFVSSLLVDRYLLSPYLIDFTIIILLSLIPSVLMIAYFHGKPGRDEWTRLEKFGIPINVLFSIILLIVIFSGKDLGATTRTVMLENEQGERIERVIPKSAFRKKIASFPFVNESADSTCDWLQYGLEFAIDYDLCQDLYIQRSNIYQSDMLGEFPMLEKMKRYGFPKGTGVPLALKKKIAQESYMDFLFTGKFSIYNDTLFISTFLYEAGSSKLRAENSFQGTDIFRLADEISSQLKLDLEIPAQYLEDSRDLPVAEMLTNSVDAFRLYISGFRRLFENDYNKAISFLEQSAVTDPTFAMAHLNLAGLYSLTNQTVKIDREISTAMNYLYKMPELYQFIVKIQYYSSKQDLDRTIALARMRTELYPEDITGYKLLAIFLRTKNLRDQELEAYKSILKIDPTEYEYIKIIGSLYKEMDDPDNALKYYEKYTEIFPEDSEAYILIGDVHSSTGNHQKAKEYYEKAILLDPDKVTILLRMASMEERTGNFNEALNQYQHCLSMCRTAKDSAEVYEYLGSYYETRGQISRSIESVQKELAASEKFQTPFVSVFGKFAFLKKFVQIGKEDLARATVESIKSDLSPPYDQFSSVGYLKIFEEAGDLENLEKAIREVESLIETFSLEMLRNLIFAARGKTCELNGDYEQAVLMYKKELELKPTDKDINHKIGACYREMGDYRKAETYLMKVLEIYPFAPRSHYELALVYHDMGKQKKALEHLNICLDIWQKADKEYIYAQQAFNKFAEWKNHSENQEPA